ncbi:MAG: hypothetical protein LQ342_006236 [Letrouitia transgressa]|nr:MAG: hypothetical protein LQ342_006236 [Letrouitia transgressa]
MKTSRYLEQILFYDQTPALARLFEERSSQLFETSNHQSFVEIHVQQPTKLIEKQNKDQIHQESLSSWEDPLEWSSEPDCNISSQPPSPVDHSHYLRPDPPRYVGSPGLHSRRISDSEELCRVATISKDMFRICANDIRIYIKSCRDLSNINPFEIHVIIIDVALANWRPYITYLTEEITKQSDKILVASVNDKDPLQLLDIEERQVLKDFEDRIIDNLLVLDSTESTITSLIENYDRFILYKPAQQETNIESFDPVAVALLEKKKEVNFCRTKVETLHAKVQGSIKLLSSLLDLGNGYALKVLAEEARKENTTMRKLTEKSTRDAAAVKVLTIITLIYLPVTVVSV